MTLHVCTWLWGDKYDVGYVRRLFAGVSKNLRQEFVPWVHSPGDEDTHLTQVPGCLARLRTFDPEWQASLGMETGDRIVVLDLDMVVTGSLDELFDHGDDFSILQGANASNPCPYNGSVWMLRAGSHADVWRNFSLEAASRVPHDKFPDDQAWMAHQIAPGARWRVGAESGIYAFKKPGWPPGDSLPRDARLVCFPGHRDPEQFTHLSWVQENWTQ